MKCTHCPGNVTSKMWLVKHGRKETVMCDWCKEDFKHNPMTEILPRRNAFMCWLRRHLI